MRWLACLALLASQAGAEEAAIEQAWRGWVDAVGATRSVLAVTKDGAIVGQFAIGMDVDDSVPVASLSKAVTGACVLALEREGLLARDAELGDVIGDRPDLIGQGARITLVSLLTHTSGLDIDETQSISHPALWGAQDMHDEVARTALARDPGPPEFFYNNENYAVLGSVIKHVTGQSVEAACAPRVFGQATTARPHPRVGGALAWGGWQMTMEELATFFASLEDETSWPAAPLGGGVSYGPGVLMRDTGQGTNLWHFGAYCMNGLFDLGAYAHLLDNGWGVAVTYNACVDEAQAIRLSTELAQAAYAE